LESLVDVKVALFKDVLAWAVSPGARASPWANHHATGLRRTTCSASTHHSLAQSNRQKSSMAS